MFLLEHIKDWMMLPLARHDRQERAQRLAEEKAEAGWAVQAQ